MNVQIFCDALQEGLWFKKLSEKLRDAEIKTIKSRGNNPRIIEELIRYDRPDIILLINNKPVLVVEKTEEVPTGHNVGQRFARIVRSAELHIPFIYFCPFVAMKHGKYANQCYINARLFVAVKNMSKIHNTPILIINWKCDDDYELIRDGSEDKELKELINDLFQNNFNFGNSIIVKKILEKMDKEYNERIKMFPNYKNPPPTVKIIKTSDFIKEINKTFGNIEIPKYFLERDYTLLYRLGMTPEKCRREDPFTGTQLVYDYIWCRYGETVKERKINLVLTIPLVTIKRWREANPDDLHRKRHLYYTIPDLLVLKDGIIVTNKIKKERKKQKTLGEIK